MFYSVDLLSKKSALGQIWCVLGGASQSRELHPHSMSRRLPRVPCLPWYRCHDIILDRRCALSTLWFRITAVLNAKVTRKKASLIDLSACCDKIREPEVPIALRLSGILMGESLPVSRSFVCSHY